MSLNDLYPRQHRDRIEHHPDIKPVELAAALTAFREGGGKVTRCQKVSRTDTRRPLGR
jgi:hypothetical protein